MRSKPVGLFFKTVAWLRTPINVWLVGILVLALSLRLATINELHWISFLDGGRDALVAKWLSEGKAEWYITPKSGWTALPNSPAYYLILAATYFLAGLEGLVGLQLMLGLGVVCLTYFISKLFAPKIISLLIATQTAISFTLIDASKAVWQPNLEYFFGALSLYFSFRAVIEAKTARWYWLSLLAIWPMLLVHHSGLPIAIIMTLVLSLSWWQNFRYKQNVWRSTIFYTWVAGIWLSWGWLTFGLAAYSQNLVFESDSNLFQNQLSVMFERSKNLIESLTWVIFSGKLNPGWVNLCLFLWLIYGLVREKKLFFKKHSLLFWQISLIFLSFGLAVFSPGEQFRPWYFFIQFYLFFLLLNITPALLNWKLRSQVILQITWIILGLVLNFNQLKFSITPGVQESFRLSQEAAVIIDSDVKQEWLKPNNFSMIVNRKFDEQQRDLEFFWTDYKSSSVQLALEDIDSAYQSRIKISPLTASWTNYLQPRAKVTYVICQDYSLADKEDCVNEIVVGTDSSVKRRITFLDQIELRPQENIYVYRLEVDKLN